MSEEQELRKLTQKSPVQGALRWFSANRQPIAEEQMELTRVPAPPFGETERGRWLADRFAKLGLTEVHTDSIGNVIGIRPGTRSEGYIALSAHLDTVFPSNTPLEVRSDGEKLYGPGISDNGAGLSAMLAVLAALNAAGVRTTAPLVFIGNVGEEGEGDLRGMRHIFSDSKWREAIAYTIVIDGAGADTIVSEALGSRRYEVTVHGPGGHSWSDFGLPNPILVLARAIESFSRTPLPSAPKTTFNVGTIQGGTSVNSIPESATMRVDLRSSLPAEIEKLERALRESLNQAIAVENRAAADKGLRGVHPLSYDMKLIGSRPAGTLPETSHLVGAVRAADAYLGNSARLQRASTDANVPLSMGREAVALGGGGTGGGAHTIHEWYDPSGRELGLKRILLAALVLAGLEQ